MTFEEFRVDVRDEDEEWIELREDEENEEWNIPMTYTVIIDEQTARLPMLDLENENWI